MKICADCKVLQPPDAFYNITKGCGARLDSYCKPCRHKRNKHARALRARASNPATKPAKGIPSRAEHPPSALPARPDKLYSGPSGPPLQSVHIESKWMYCHDRKPQ